jgi:5,10-methylenetetrahydromethanopterin reductase
VARITVSIRLNNDLPASALGEIAAAAERGGFDQLWVSHDLFWRSAPVLLTHLAGRTSTLALGVAILNPYSLHPAEIAMAAATLHEVCGGRFRLGLGAGAREFLQWAGLLRRRPLQRTRQAVLAVRALLRGDRPAREAGAGPGWGEEAYLRFPAAEVPIYIGGMSPRMLALAGEVADGALPLLFPPEHFPTALSQIRDGARSAGRELDQLDVAACIWCSVDEDPVAARTALARKIAYYGPSFAPYLLRRAGIDPGEFSPVQQAWARGDVDGACRMVTPAMLALGVAGGPEEVIRRCRWLLGAGATHISFGPPLGPDPLRAVHVLGATVLPALRGP